MAHSSKGPSRHPAVPALPLVPPRGRGRKISRTTPLAPPFLLAPPLGRDQADWERAAGWVFAYKGGHARDSAVFVAASAPPISSVEPPAELLSQPSRSRGRGPQHLGEAGPGGAGRGPQGRVGGCSQAVAGAGGEMPVHPASRTALGALPSFRGERFRGEMENRPRGPAVS